MQEYDCSYNQACCHLRVFLHLSNMAYKYPSAHISRFLKRFEVLDCLKAANIKKVKGFPLASLFLFLFTLVFTHKNFYRHMDEKSTLFGKDIGYRLTLILTGDCFCLSWLLPSLTPFWNR
jgi:hypothetical protein